MDGWIKLDEMGWDGMGWDEMGGWDGMGWMKDGMDG